jgi:hypothetical protein
MAGSSHQTAHPRCEWASGRKLSRQPGRGVDVVAHQLKIGEGGAPGRGGQSLGLAVVVDVGPVNAAPVWEVVETNGLFVAEVANLVAAGVIADLFWVAEASAAAELLSADNAVGEFHFRFHAGVCTGGG